MTFSPDLQAALIADGEKLAALTGEDHGPYFDRPIVAEQQGGGEESKMEVTEKMLDAYKHAASKKLVESTLGGSGLYDPDIGRAAGIKAAMAVFFETPTPHEREIWNLIRLIGDLNPADAVDDSLLRDIHLRLQTHGEKYPERMVSVLHRNVVLWAVSEAIEAKRSSSPTAAP